MPPTRSRRIALVVLLGLAAVAVLAMVLLKPLARWAVLRSARSHGLALELGELELGWNRLGLQNSRIRLLGVDGVQLEARELVVEMSGLFAPYKVHGNGLTVEIEGSATDALLGLADWASHNPEAVRFSVSAEDVDVLWRHGEEGGVWMTVEDAVIAPIVNGATMEAPQAMVLGVPMGPVGAQWASDRSRVSLAFGKSDLATAPLRLDVHYEQRPVLAKLSLRKIAVKDLALPFGTTLPVPLSTSLRGHAEWFLPERGAAAQIDAKVHVELGGFVPPHPKELDGIMFGDRTVVDARVLVAEARQRMELKDVVVEAGALKLRGEGGVTRARDHALIAMTLRGAVPCSALARSAVSARLPGALGKLLGDAANRALTGAVQVALVISADTRDLAAAKVDRSARVECGLRLP